MLSLNTSKYTKKELACNSLRIPISNSQWLLTPFSILGTMTGQSFTERLTTFQRRLKELLLMSSRWFMEIREILLELVYVSQGILPLERTSSMESI